MNINFPKFLTFLFRIGNKIFPNEETVQSWENSGQKLGLRYKYTRVKIGEKYIYVQYNDDNHKERIQKIFAVRTTDGVQTLPGFKLFLYAGFEYAVPKPYKEGYWTIAEVEMFVNTYNLLRAVDMFKEAADEMVSALKENNLVDFTGNFKTKHNILHILEKTLPDKLETVNQVCAMEYKS
jgi:hypothetical protein